MKNLALMLLMLYAAAAAHAEPASVVRAVDLLAQSQSDAAKIASLAPGAKVEVLRRVGAWSEIKTVDGKAGWVRMTALKFGAEGGQAAAKPAGSPLSALGDLLAAGRTSNDATVTTGVRGLTEEDLEKAQANPAELDKMKKFAADAQTAKKFASSAKLSANKVEYLPAPRRNGQSGSEEE